MRFLLSKQPALAGEVLCGGGVAGIAVDLVQRTSGGGVEWVDHQGLVEVVNRLAEALLSGQGAAEGGLAGIPRETLDLVVLEGLRQLGLTDVQLEGES